MDTSPIRPLSLVICTILVASVIPNSIGLGDEAHHHDEGTTTATTATQPHGQTNVQKAWFGDPYLLSHDPVTGEVLAEVEEPVVVQHEDREIRFASEAEYQEFEADPEKYLESIDAQIIEQQRPYYPLDTCIVTGDRLGGEMGEAIIMSTRTA